MAVRHLNDQVPALACWELGTGAHRWTALLDNYIPVSDPFHLAGQWGVLTLDKQRAVDAQLYLQLVRTESGQLGQRYPLIRVRDNWWQRMSCEVLTDGDTLFATLGGVTCACDVGGQLHWVRSTPSLPPEADPNWLRQWHAPPLRIGDVLFTAQVGVRAVEAVDTTTGDLRWRTVLPDVEQILGPSGGHLIVRCREAVAALDQQSGHLRWQTEVEPLLLAAALDDQRILVSHTAPTGVDGQSHVVLQLLDSESGAPLARHALDALHGSQPNLGPLVLGDQRAWTFFSAGSLAGQRELIELRWTEAP